MRAIFLLLLATLTSCSDGQATSQATSSNRLEAGAITLAKVALQGRVTDDADILNPAQEASLSTRLQEFERASGHQMVVVTVRSLGGRDIAAFTKELGNTWGIGRAEQDDGIIVLVAPKERKARIEVGLGSDGSAHGCGRAFTDWDFRPVNYIWMCPDPLRLVLIAVICALILLGASLTAYWIARRQATQPSLGYSLARMTCVGLSVGAFYLSGTYLSQFLGSQGILSPLYVVGVPFLLSMVHFPRPVGLVLSIPALVLGFFGIVFIAVVTGIPLD